MNDVPLRLVDNRRRRMNIKVGEDKLLGSNV